jgi:hypothetical protein
VGRRQAVEVEPESPVAVRRAELAGGPALMAAVQAQAGPALRLPEAGLEQSRVLAALASLRAPAADPVRMPAVVPASRVLWVGPGEQAAAPAWRAARVEPVEQGAALAWQAARVEPVEQEAALASRAASAAPAALAERPALPEAVMLAASPAWLAVAQADRPAVQAVAPERGSSAIRAAAARQAAVRRALSAVARRSAVADLSDRVRRPDDGGDPSARRAPAVAPAKWSRRQPEYCRARPST